MKKQLIGLAGFAILFGLIQMGYPSSNEKFGGLDNLPKEQVGLVDLVGVGESTISEDIIDYPLSENEVTQVIGEDGGIRSLGEHRASDDRALKQIEKRLLDKGYSISNSTSTKDLRTTQELFDEMIKTGSFFSSYVTISDKQEFLIDNMDAIQFFNEGRVIAYKPEGDNNFVDLMNSFVETMNEDSKDFLHVMKVVYNGELFHVVELSRGVSLEGYTGKVLGGSFVLKTKTEEFLLGITKIASEFKNEVRTLVPIFEFKDIPTNQEKIQVQDTYVGLGYDVYYDRWSNVFFALTDEKPTDKMVEYKDYVIYDFESLDENFIIGVLKKKPVGNPKIFRFKRYDENVIEGREDIKVYFSSVVGDVYGYVKISYKAGTFWFETVLDEKFVPVDDLDYGSYKPLVDYLTNTYFSATVMRYENIKDIFNGGLDLDSNAMIKIIGIQ